MVAVVSARVGDAAASELTTWVSSFGPMGMVPSMPFGNWLYHQWPCRQEVRRLCPQHMTKALGRWAGDSIELYERVDIEDSLHWFAQISSTDVNPAEVSRLVTQQHLPDPVEDDAISAIETELRAFSAGGG